MDTYSRPQLALQRLEELSIDGVLEAFTNSYRDDRDREGLPAYIVRHFGAVSRLRPGDLRETSLQVVQQLSVCYQILITTEATGLLQARRYTRGDLDGSRQILRPWVERAENLRITMLSLFAADGITTEE